MSDQRVHHRDRSDASIEQHATIFIRGDAVPPHNNAVVDLIFKMPLTSN